MSGLEVIGGISAIITLLDASIKVYDNARNDMKLSESFYSVRRRLPVVQHILQTCERDLEPFKESMPSDTCEALEKILDSCNENGRKLREIFEEVIPGEKDTWEKRYAKVIRRLGKGNKVEELMVTLTSDVQLIVNHHAVNSATQDQNSELKTILREMDHVKSLTAEEDHLAFTFNSGGGMQTNNVNSGSGQQINNNAPVGTQNFHSVSFKHKEDFSFRGPVGILLSQAPYIASELFVGRGSELDEIAKALKRDRNVERQQRLVLGGMGGIGKTQLAIAYTQSGRGESYGSVFWLNAVSEAALKASFRSIAGLIFDLDLSGVFKDEDLLRRVHQWLCTVKNTGWLLIFDNYDDPVQFQIEKYYPPASHGVIIVTTRRPDLVAGTILHVQPLKKIGDCLAILQTRSKREDVHSDPHAKRLAERLAGLPLALATAGTYLQRSNFTFERYLQEYEKRWNIDPGRPLQLQEYRNRTLYTTWDLSYSRLEMEDPGAARFMKLLAYFDNRSLWYELFHAGITEKSPSWLREAINDDISFSGVMGSLANYYFLNVHRTFESWSMHECVHDWTLATLNKDIDEKYYWYAFDCISASIKGVNKDDFGKHSCSHLAAQAMRLVQQRFCQKDAIYNIPAGRLHQASLIADLLQDQILLVDAEQMYQRVLAGYEKELGLDHTLTLSTLHNLGLLYSHQDKPNQAEQMYQRALAGYEKSLGEDHISTLNTVNNLGLLFSDQDKLNQAEQMLQRALAGRENTHGFDHKLTLDSVNNLGNLYLKRGNLDQAEIMYERALAGYEKRFGLDHISTLRTFNNLGLLYSHQEKLKQAEQMYQRALTGYEKELGEDHISTLSSVNNLGSLYWKQGKLSQAETMYERALAGYEKALGANHTSTLDTVNNLGLLYSHQDKINQAENMYKCALAGYEKALGANHTSTLGTVNNLGLLYSHQDKLNQAEQMLQRALDGQEKALGLDHKLTLDTVHNIGNVFLSRGKLDEAEELYQRALVWCEKTLGMDHLSTLETVNNLGNLYHEKGELDEAEQMHQRALARKEKSLGMNHMSTLDTANNLAVTFHDLGKLSEAEHMYKRALVGREQTVGSDHSLTLNTINNLAVMYCDQGKLDEAEQMHQRVLARREILLGLDHRLTLDTVNNLGILYVKRGELDKGEQMFQRALAGKEKLLGTSHMSTLDIVHNLELLHQQKGNLRKKGKTISSFCYPQ